MEIFITFFLSAFFMIFVLFFISVFSFSPLAGLILVAIMYFFYFRIKNRISKLESKINKFFPIKRD